MDQSPFAQLPKELRLIIYEYALSTDCSVSIQPYMSQPQDGRYPVAGLRIEPYPDPVSDTDEECSNPTHQTDRSPETSSDDDEDSDASSGISFVCGNALLAARAASDKDSQVQMGKVFGSNPLALTATCRQLRQEALPIFYVVNGISLMNDKDVYARFPTLQTILLTHWLRHIPGAQTGLFRHVAVSIHYKSKLPGDTESYDLLAREVYERYVEIASCFDTSRTQLSLDLGGHLEPDPTGAGALRSDRHVFVMTPWNGLRLQIETCVRESEARFQKAKEIEGMMRWVEMFEGHARTSREVLRRLVDLVEGRRPVTIQRRP